MSELTVSRLCDHGQAADKEESPWVCERRLPCGATVITGLAGASTSQKTLQGVGRALFAEYAAAGSVGGAPAEEGAAVYVSLGPRKGRTAPALSAAFGGEAPEEAYLCAGDLKLGSSLASELGRVAREIGDARLFIVDGAGVGCEGRQKLSSALSELSRMGRACDAAVAVLMPLTKRNALSVKDPSTGISSAADAVWEVYADPAGATKVFCTSDAGGEAFGLAALRQKPRSAPGVRVQRAGCAPDEPEAR